MDLPSPPQSLEQRLRTTVVEKIKLSSSRWRNLKLALSILSIVLIAGAQIWIANSTGPANGLQNFLWGAGVLLIVIVTAVQFFDERGDSAVLAIAEEAIAESNKARKKTEDFTLGLTTLEVTSRVVV